MSGGIDTTLLFISTSAGNRLSLGKFIHQSNGVTKTVVRRGATVKTSRQDQQLRGDRFAASLKVLERDSNRRHQRWKRKHVIADATADHGGPTGINGLRRVKEAVTGESAEQWVRTIPCFNPQCGKGVAR